jgi:hypothetical protein
MWSPDNKKPSSAESSVAYPMEELPVPNPEDTNPLDATLIGDGPDERTKDLLREVNGDETEPISETEETESEVAPEAAPVDLTRPLTAADLETMRTELAEKEQALERKIAKVREQRRRANRRAEVLEGHVRELVARTQTTPAAVRLDHDDEGNPILTRDAVTKAIAQVQPQNTQALEKAQVAAAGYGAMKESLIDQDDTYQGIFTRLEGIANELHAAAQAEGETLNTPDDVADFMETSDLGTNLRAKYPEVSDWEEYGRAVTSTRAARKLAEKIRAAAKKPPTNGSGKNHAPAPVSDLTSGVRDRIRSKANQTGRSRSTGAETDISLEEAAHMTPEQLALPLDKREKVRAAIRRGFQA